MRLGILAEKRVGPRQMVRNLAFRPDDFVDRLARVRADVAGDLVLVVAAADDRLRVVRRVGDDRDERHVVAVPDEMLADRRPVAAGQAVAAGPAFLQVRGRHRQDVLFPRAGRKAHRGVQRVVGRMRTSVHPDRPLGAPGEMVRVDRDELLRRGVALFPDAHAGEARHVVGRMHAALVFRQRDERRVPGVGAQAYRVVHRQPGVVAELGTEQAIGPILLENSEVVPDARQIDLGRAGRCDAKTQEKGKKQQEEGKS